MANPALQHPLRINAPTYAPPGSSQFVDHAFPGFAIETSDFQDYAGNKTIPNTFSRNLVRGIADRTGEMPIIRVGGSTADHTEFLANQTVGTLAVPGALVKGNGNTEGITIGPSWFEGFSNFPGAKFVFGINLNPAYTLANAIAEARMAVQYIGPHLDAFEVGNEPNHYQDYTFPDYVQNWLEYTEAISSGVLANSSIPARIYQALAYASAPQKYPWTIQNAFQSGIDKNSNIKTVSLHRYGPETSPKLNIENAFMNHDTIVSMANFSEDVQYLRKNHPDIPFILGETNLGLQVGKPIYSDAVFGEALGLADYMLYSMSINITRMNIYMATGIAYSAWQPVEYNGSPPQVRPSYYAQVFAADFIGTSPQMQIYNIDLGLANMSAYAAYDHGKLARIAIVNLDEWNTTIAYLRPLQQICIRVPQGVESVLVKYLTSPGANSTNSITWGGVSWSYASNGVGVKVENTDQIVEARDGVAQIIVKSSEAVMVTIPACEFAPGGPNSPGSPRGPGDPQGLGGPGGKCRLPSPGRF